MESDPIHRATPEIPVDPVSRHAIAAWSLMLVALVAVLQLQLLPALLSGLLAYELVHILGHRLPARGGRGKLMAVGVLIVLVIAGLTLASLGLTAVLHSDAGSVAALLHKLADILDALPRWITESLPSGPEGIKQALVDWLRGHAKGLQSMGKEAGHMLAHVLIGVVIGAMAALNEAAEAHQAKALEVALLARVAKLADAFRRIVFAQVRIAAINAVFTAFYLLVALPFFGIHLPFAKTMVLVTFCVGLLPVVGNLISNTVIVVVSLAHSPHAAIGSLAFLVVIHKLEYFLNARIVGSKIRARAWELLLAMLVMESAFGIAGLVAAPIYYAYLKEELKTAGQI
jgi:predicted PurR-regulated permease PerM